MGKVAMEIGQKCSTADTLTLPSAAKQPSEESALEILPDFHLLYTISKYFAVFSKTACNGNFTNTAFWFQSTHRFIASCFYFPKYKNYKIICETQETFRSKDVNFSGNDPEFTFVSMKNVEGDISKYFTGRLVWIGERRKATKISKADSSECCDSGGRKRSVSAVNHFCVLFTKFSSSQDLPIKALNHFVPIILETNTK